MPTHKACRANARGVRCRKRLGLSGRWCGWPARCPVLCCMEIPSMDLLLCEAEWAQKLRLILLDNKAGQIGSTIFQDELRAGRTSIQKRVKRCTSMGSADVSEVRMRSVSAKG